MTHGMLLVYLKEKVQAQATEERNCYHLKAKARLRLDYHSHVGGSQVDRNNLAKNSIESRVIECHFDVNARLAFHPKEGAFRTLRLAFILQC